MKENSPKFRCWSLRCLLLGFVLALITAVVFYAAFPPQHRATASLLMRATAPTFLFERSQLSHYNVFVNTQIALLRSPPVLDKALEDPMVATLPIILKQNDKRGWLMGKLRVKREGKSELVSVSIKTDDAAASEKIVNTVVDVYLKYTTDNDRKMVNTLILELTGEKRRQQAAAQIFQESIRAAAQRTGDTAETEKAQDEIAFLRAQLNRIDNTLDRIDARILAINAEARAPGQIVHLMAAVSSPPSIAKQVMVAGVGFLVVFFSALLLGIVMDCLRFIGFCRTRRKSGSCCPPQSGVNFSAQ